MPLDWSRMYSKIIWLKPYGRAVKAHFLQIDQHLTQTQIWCLTDVQIQTIVIVTPYRLYIETKHA